MKRNSLDWRLNMQKFKIKSYMGIKYEIHTNFTCWQGLMVLGPLCRTSPMHLAFLCTIRSWRWGYGQLHSLLPSTFLDFFDSWLTSWGSLEMQTQVPPWLSNDAAESCSSLFVSDTPAALMIKERTSLVFAWKLHFQWLRGVFCVTMVVHGLTRHSR